MIFFSLTQISYHVEKGIILKMNHIIHNKERGYHITRWSKSNNQSALNMMNNKKDNNNNIKMICKSFFGWSFGTMIRKWEFFVSTLQDDVHPWNNIELLINNQNDWPKFDYCWLVDHHDWPTCDIHVPNSLYTIQSFLFIGGEKPNMNTVPQCGK